MTAGGQAPTRGGPVSARGASRLAWSSATAAMVLVATSVALFVQGAGRLEDFSGPDALAAVAYSVVGALVVSRRPGNRIGWLFCVVGPFSALYAFAEQYARHSLVTRPGSLPGGGWAAWLAAWTWVPSAFVGLVFLPLLFPDGRLPSARWRPAAWFALAALGILMLSTSLGPVQVLGYAAGSLLFVLVAGAGSNPPGWLVAGATLVAAAAFRPVRRRIQATVDRRFNRHRHDAARTVEAFGARLREQVELDTLSAELLAVVNQTKEPARLSLWLRPHLERPTAAHR